LGFRAIRGFKGEIGTTGSREGFAGTDTGREEKRKKWWLEAREQWEREGWVLTEGMCFSRA